MRCENEYAELMGQVADPEFQIEAGLINSYEDYTFTWGRSAPARPAPPDAEPEAAHPSRRARASPDEPPF